MYVCVCNSVSDRQIRRAVSEGVSTLDDLRLELGVGNCCGKCLPCARQVLRTARAETDLLAQAAPAQV